MGTTRQKSSCRNRLQNAPRSLSCVKAGTHSALLKGSHTRAHTPKQGCFGRGWYHYPRSVPHVSETLRGRVSERRTLPLLGLGHGCSQRTQRAFGTAMRLCASLSRGVAAPPGCVIFSVSVEIAACTPCAQCFPNVRDGGWYRYPRCALCASEMPDGRLSKGLICRFLRLGGRSSPHDSYFLANTQNFLSAISVANAFPPPTTAGLCASSRIASNRTTTVSLGCMDSSSFGCLIVLDSSSTYTTRS